MQRLQIRIFYGGGLERGIRNLGHLCVWAVRRCVKQIAQS